MGSRYIFADDGNKPLLSRGFADSDRLDISIHYPGEKGLDLTDLREFNGSFFDLPSSLGIGDPVVSAFSFEPWIPRVFPQFGSSEKCFEFLKNLRMNCFQFRVILFPLS